MVQTSLIEVAETFVTVQTLGNQYIDTPQGRRVPLAPSTFGPFKTRGAAAEWIDQNVSDHVTVKIHTKFPVNS